MQRIFNSGYLCLRFESNFISTAFSFLSIIWCTSVVAKNRILMDNHKKAMQWFVFVPFLNGCHCWTFFINSIDKKRSLCVCFSIMLADEKWCTTNGFRRLVKMIMQPLNLLQLFRVVDWKWHNPNGITYWFIVMPKFIYVTSAALPHDLSKFLVGMCQSETRKNHWRKFIGNIRSISAFRFAQPW